MLVLDASSIIYGWDNYPIDKFPRLWDWLAQEIGSVQLGISEIAFDEVEARSPDCYSWLRETEIQVIAIREEMLTLAATIKNMLGIHGDAYHPRGVGENDLLIISCAKVDGHRLVTDESRQPALPTQMKCYKIPAVCNLPAVKVTSMNFLELLKSAPGAF